MKKHLKTLAALALAAFFAYNQIEVQEPLDTSPTVVQASELQGTLSVSYDLSQLEFQPLAWSDQVAPDFITELTVPIDKASIQAVSVATGNIYYAPLDHLGRSGVAYGVITPEMVAKSKGHRENFEPKSEPSGWFRYYNRNSGKEITEQAASISSRRGVEKVSNNKKIALDFNRGKKTKTDFYNRSHQIADALGGRAFRQNLVTGTRYQNVGNNNGKGGFRFAEKVALDAVATYPNSPLHYFVKPYYIGNELVPRGSLIVMFNDAGFEKVYYVYNNARGFDIDYLNGNFTESGNSTN